MHLEILIEFRELSARSLFIEKPKSKSADNVEPRQWIREKNIDNKIARKTDNQNINMTT